MKFQITCESCEGKIKIDYDETTYSVQYCPFCGEELEEDGEYEFDVDVPGDEDE